MEDFIIRRAEERDVPALEKIEKLCFSVPWTYESLYHDVTENKAARYLVTETEQGICGYMGIWKILDEGHITNVAVDPAFRRRHIASAMLEAMTEIMAEEGVTSLTLEVRAGNLAARELYRKKGFREAGIRKGYYEDNGEDALIMWRRQDGEEKNSR